MGKFNMNPLWFGPFMDRLLYISWNITFKKYEMAQISIYLNIKILKIILFEIFFFYEGWRGGMRVEYETFQAQ